MRVDSTFIQNLDNTPVRCTQAYPTYCYVALGDEFVGEVNSAPQGQTPWWIGTSPLISPHAGAFLDPRIRADIVRRLRGESPLTTDPPAAVPS